MEFSFPYQPYDIQLNLMRAIKSCIEDEQVGIFESPTGTGKSLSVLCSTLTWLEEFERNHESELEAKIKAHQEQDDGGSDWMEAQKRKIIANRTREAARDEMEDLQRVRSRIERAKRGEVTSRKRRRVSGDEDQNEPPVDELAPPESYASDEEKADDEPAEPLKTVKIFYASRTHSQLEQLVNELDKTRFKPRIVTAASRQTLCTNDGVQKLKINHLINEKCMELRKNGCGDSKKSKNGTEGAFKKKSNSGCCYYKADAIEDLENGILAGSLTRPGQVATQGKQSVGCAYFATRRAIPLCQLVMLPYQVLLHAATRAAWGVELAGNVVILDEAHNVLQTIGNLYSAEVSGGGLSVAMSLCKDYVDTYKTRLKAKNLMYMRQLLNVITSMDRYIRSPGVVEGDVLTIQAIIIKLGLSDVNIFKLVHYMDATDLCKKFHGFYLRSQKKEVKLASKAPASGISKLLKKAEPLPMKPSVPEPEAEPAKPIPSPLFAIKSFLEALNNRCEDGRIIIEKKALKYRFILLNPADRLSEVVQQARACILVGGTMEPSGLLVDSLSRGLPSYKSIRRFSCQHVIDDDQLAVLAVGRTIDEKPFSLTYEQRSNDQVVRSLAASLVQLVTTVPNGSVAFFPSYDYMYSFLEKMKAIGQYAKLQERKAVYVEPRGPSSEIWEKFVTSARSAKGAILFAVVGGKLSEGINFSDELGRAVFMIGLPYPNKNSTELKEKMKYLDGQLPSGGKQLYDSLCMHSVNQAVGRAIRHRNDYAAVFLLDQRFSNQAVSRQLSGWIGSRLQSPASFAQCVTISREFFNAKKK